MLLLQVFDESVAALELAHVEHGDFATVFARIILLREHHLNVLSINCLGKI